MTSLEYGHLFPDLTKASKGVKLDVYLEDRDATDHWNRNGTLEICPPKQLQALDVQDPQRATQKPKGTAKKGGS